MVSTQRTLELTTFSPATADLSEKRPDTTDTNWPTEKSLRMIVSKSIVNSNNPVSVDPLRILKQRELQKASKYSTLVQSQGGELSPLVTGANGNITASTKKVLQIICSSQDNTNPRFTCLWLLDDQNFLLTTEVSCKLSYTSLSRSALHNGRQWSTLSSRETFPDSVDIHLQMNQWFDRL